MSEPIGVIGQKYENRRTKKSGVLVERDEEKKSLQLLDDATGEPFSVSESSFRSNWRKAVSAVEEPVEVEEEVEEETPKFATDKDAVDDFIRAISGERDIHFTHNPAMSDVTELIIDGIRALTMNKDDGGVRVSMLPDLYTYSDIKEHVVAGTLHFNADNHLSVSFITDYETFGEVLQSIKEAAIEINLYGYFAE